MKKGMDDIDEDILLKAARVYGYNKIMEEGSLEEVLSYVARKYYIDKGYVPVEWLEVIRDLLEKEEL